LAKAQEDQIKINYKEKDFFNRLGSSSKHQGVALEFFPKETSLNQDDFLSQVVKNNGVVILLDQLTDPHNVGSIIRTSEALGVDGLILSKNNSVSINSTVVKSSAGATAYLKIITISNVASFIEKAKRIGFWIIGATDHGDSELEKIRNIRPVLLIIGSEGQGMRRLTEEKIDYAVRIPLKGQISSLNASVAAGIIIYEILK
jgi:23S rRNA (guanosine2251-2'-O)-methyltransferase